MFFTKEGRKLLKNRQVSVIAIVFFIIPSSILITIFPHYVFHALPINIIFLVIAVFFMLSRHGSLRLSSDSNEVVPEFSTISWLLLILAIELFSILLFSSLLQTSNAYLPQVFIAQGIKPQVPAAIVSILCLRWGLFPFSLYGLLAGILAYAYFYKKQPGLLSAAIPPLKSVYFDRQVRRGINIFCSKLSDIAASIILIIAILQLNLLLLHWIGMDNTNNIRMGGIVCYAISSLLLVSPLYDRYVKFISRHSQRAYAFLIPFIIIVVALLVTSAFVGQFLYQQVADKLNEMEEFQKKIILLFFDWHLLYFAWWVCVAPLFSSMIARVSRGKTLRGIIAATLLLPAVVASSLIIQQHYPEIAFSAFVENIGNVMSHAGHNRFINLVAPWTVVIFLMTVKDGRYSIFGFMPYKKSYVTARPVKIKYLMKALLQFTALMIVAFLFANLRSIQLLSSLAAIPGMIFFILCCVGFYALLIVEKS